MRFIRNTPGLEPLAEKHSRRLKDTVLIERRLVQAIIAQGSPLAGKEPPCVFHLWCAPPLVCSELKDGACPCYS